MKIKLLLTLALTAFITSCASIPEPSPEELIGAKPYPLDVCLVIEKPLKDTPKTYTKVYKGQILKFCCKSCYRAFDKHPDLFMQKVK